MDRHRHRAVHRCDDAVGALAVHIVRLREDVKVAAMWIVVLVLIGLLAQLASETGAMTCGM